MLRHTILHIAFALLASRLSGATTSELRINREQAVTRSLAQNKILVAARVTIEQAKARSLNSSKLDNPELRIDYGSDWAFNDEGESAFSLGFEQRFPITNRLRHLSDIAAVEIDLAHAEIRDQERLLAQEVERAFISLAHTEAQLELQQSQVALTQESASFIESRIQTGEASSIEANQTRIELYIMEQRIQKLELERIAHLSELKLLLGLETAIPLSIQFSLSLPDKLPELPTFTVGMLGRHPEHQVHEFLHEIASKRTALALAQRWDDIAVRVFFKDERSVDEPNGIGTDRFAGVGISIPLPLRNRNRGAIAESKAKEHQVHLEHEAHSLEMRNASDRLQNEVATRYRQAKHYHETVAQLVEQNLEDMNHAYSAGQINLTDLFRAQEQRLAILSDHLTMIRDYEYALVDWKAATAQNLEL